MLVALLLILLNKADFMSLYTDKAENSSYTETFSMFLRYCSFKEGKVTTSFLGIVN